LYISFLNILDSYTLTCVAGNPLHMTQSAEAPPSPVNCSISETEL